MFPIIHEGQVSDNVRHTSNKNKKSTRRDYFLLFNFER